MKSIFLISTRLVVTVLLSSFVLAACSSSGTNDDQALIGTTLSKVEEFTTVNDDDSDGAIVEEMAPDGMKEETLDNNVTDNSMEATATDTDSGEAVDVESDTVGLEQIVPDPMEQSTSRVDFSIQVPVYQSNELQVRLTWGQHDITATWIGDEFWSATADFPINTEHLLVTTFYDGNGDVTLGRAEQNFKTGFNSAESVQISVEQFDTDRYDDDGDGVSNLDESNAVSDGEDALRILLFSETRDFRHESIADALNALEELASSANIQADRAEDSAGMFNDASLANYAAVVWVQTSGDVLNAAEQAAFERYVRSGGGYAGIHAASFTEYDWPWYGQLVGAYFDSHPAVQSAVQNVENSSHLSTAHLDLKWLRTDEWYDYRTNPRAQVNVLLSLDEDSYTGGTMGTDHPSAWFHDYDGGRSWYTGGGHTSSSYQEPEFRAHLLGGLKYAAGLDG